MNLKKKKTSVLLKIIKIHRLQKSHCSVDALNALGEVEQLKANDNTSLQPDQNHLCKIQHVFPI